MYLSERKKEVSAKLLSQLIHSFGKTVGLFRKLMFDILKEDTEGRNYLSSPIMDDCDPEIAKVLCEMKRSEAKNVTIAEQIQHFAEITCCM